MHPKLFRSLDLYADRGVYDLALFGYRPSSQRSMAWFGVSISHSWLMHPLTSINDLDSKRHALFSILLVILVCPVVIRPSGQGCGKVKRAGAEKQLAYSLEGVTSITYCSSLLRSRLRRPAGPARLGCLSSTNGLALRHTSWCAGVFFNNLVYAPVPSTFLGLSRFLTQPILRHHRRFLSLDVIALHYCSNIKISWLAQRTLS